MTAKQGNLFDDPYRPYQAHSETSEQAAEEMPAASARTIREKVFAFLLERGWEGATDEEMQISLVLGGSTQRPRRVELLAAERIMDSGRRRHTSSGRQAVVWVTR